MAGSQRVSCGRDSHCTPDINETLEDACRNGFDFLCTTIVNPRNKRELLEGPAKNRQGALTRSDILLTGQDWSTLIVAKISPWIQVESSEQAVRRNSEKALEEELNFASHLSVPAILIPLRTEKCVNLARILNTHILQGHNHQFWIHIPLVAPEDAAEDLIDRGLGDSEDEEEEEEKENNYKHDTWTWWNRLRVLCDTSKKLGVAIELTADIPSQPALQRWLGEPIKAAILPTSIFLTNRKGYPVLPRAHQLFIQSLFKLDVQVIVTGSCKHMERGLRTYQQYLDHLYQTQEPLDQVGRFAKGYEDYLQCPLQPLMDNLESGTYEVFEKDPVKYSQYQKAIHAALLDRVSDEEKETKEIVVMVLGAGRGPLVRASLVAADNARRKIRVYAVEKNPNAVVTLENLKYEQWGKLVTIVSSDMREWDAPEKADIIVSELLGSFGDNELSPECLDGAQKFLKDDGISIPIDYTSYIAPVSSSKLWNEARLCKDANKSPDAAYEMPYVVRLNNVVLLDTPQPLFFFKHPNKGLIDNSRYDDITFTAAQESILHGFAGYFECTLYKDIMISIVPQTHSPGMFSWFPIYFPIKEPMAIKRGDDIEVHFWRLVNPKNVWYEWCVTKPYTRPLHNPKGRSYTIGL